MRLLCALKYTVDISLIYGKLRHPTTLWSEKVPDIATFTAR